MSDALRIRLEGGLERLEAGVERLETLCKLARGGWLRDPNRFAALLGAELELGAEEAAIAGRAAAMPGGEAIAARHARASRTLREAACELFDASADADTAALLRTWQAQAAALTSADADQSQVIWRETYLRHGTGWMIAGVAAALLGVIALSTRGVAELVMGVTAALLAALWRINGARKHGWVLTYDGVLMTSGRSVRARFFPLASLFAGQRVLTKAGVRFSPRPGLLPTAHPDAVDQCLSTLRDLHQLTRGGEPPAAWLEATVRYSLFQSGPNRLRWVERGPIRVAIFGAEAMDALAVVLGDELLVLPWDTQDEAWRVVTGTAAEAALAGPELPLSQLNQVTARGLLRRINQLAASELLRRLPLAALERHRAALGRVGALVRLPPGFAPDGESPPLPLGDGREVTIRRPDAPGGSSPGVTAA